MNIEWSTPGDNSEMSLSHLYDRYVQLLYNYGMNACHDHVLVQNALKELFKKVANEGEFCMATRTIRFCLFKRLRDLIVRRRVELGNSDDLFTMSTSASGMMPMHVLSVRQREAIFLKLNYAFSYHETAAIMGINTESVYKLVAQAVDMVRRESSQGNPSKWQDAPESRKVNTLEFNLRYT